MNGILEQLQEKNVRQLTEEETQELTKNYPLEKEYETGLSGPIKILKLADEENKLILESNERGKNYIRILKTKNIQEFVSERLEVYNKMWDGCGCKVYYDEVWTSAKEEKNIEI